ncbi:MAG: glycosyltransferase family 9 protein, partial [Chloroflexi bacterium]
RGPHAVEDLISVLDRIDSARRIPPARVWLSENERAWAKTRLAALPAGRHLAMGPGANWEPKIWPLDHFRSLLDKVADRFEGVLILGGPGDRERATLLARDLPLPALNLTGETTLLQAAALLEHCSLFVGNDSGLGHMAAAVETPTITVFGPGQPERYHPWSPCAHWLRGPEDRLELLAPDTVAATLLEHLG